jgi:glucose/arabinose dehydrogenase
MRLLSVFVLSAALTVPVAPTAADAPSDPTTTGQPRAQAFPELHVRRQVRGLQIPWDVQRLPRGRLLIGERDTHRLILWRAGHRRVLRFPARVWVSGETGLMGLAVDPRFKDNRRVYTCQGGFTRTGHDIRVVAWRMNRHYTGVRRIKVLLRGIPAATNGLHGGCRLLITRGGALLIGTGDAFTGTNPRNLDSLGGKVLRINRFTGKPSRHNPWASATSARRFVLNYGHRNVQGLAERADGSLWSVEHGPDRDDEINLLVPGGDYGWSPVPGYNQTVPMTDDSLPGTQVHARWSSGSPTLATAGAAWVSGREWGEYDGTLAVASLKASRLVFFKFDAAGNLLWTRTPDAVKHFGRLRSVTRAHNGDLLVTTSNGTGDAVLRVSPR